MLGIMTDKNMPAQTGPITPSQEKSRKTVPLICLLAILLIAAAGCGAYYWQHNKLLAANQKLQQSDSDASALNAKLAGLQSKYAQIQKALAGSQNASTTQSHLDLTIDNADYIYPYGTLTHAPGPGWLGVQVSLTNPTSNTIYITVKDFKIKDQQDNVYPQSSYSTSPNLPSGWALLDDQSLAPGETVKGVMIFNISSQSIKNFTLMNGTKSYAVTAG